MRTGLDALHRTLDELSQVNARLLAAHADAQAANESKTKFLAAVSHDLLQPLNAARLFTSALQEQSFGPKAEGLVRSVSTSLDDVENLLGTLVDISKLELFNNFASNFHFCYEKYIRKWLLNLSSF